MEAHEYALGIFLKSEPVYQCGTCGARVTVEKPLIMRLGGRLYVGRPCPHCGSFVGVSLPTEVRKGTFIPEEEMAQFEEQNGLKLGEDDWVEVAFSQESEPERGHIVTELNSALQDYVNMLAERGAMIVDGHVTNLGEKAKQEIMESVEAEKGWWV